MSEEELPGCLQSAINVEKQVWPHTANAEEWAKQWKEHLSINPEIANDEGCMVGWFANAIMAGFNTACSRWRHIAYAKLGEERDLMTPEAVRIVQNFLKSRLK